MNGGITSALVELDDGRIAWRVSGLRGSSPNDKHRSGKGASWRATMGDRQRERDRFRVLLLATPGRNALRSTWAVPELAELVVREWPKNRDLDNAAAAVKYLLDALVWDDWLVDDRHLVRLVVERPGARPAWAKGDSVELRLGAFKKPVDR